MIDIELRFILDDRVSHRADLINLTAKVVVRQRGQVLRPVWPLGVVLGVEAFLAYLSFADSVLLDDGRDVDVPIGRALDRLLVFVLFLHLPADVLVVEMGRDLHGLKPFHQLLVFDINALGFLLLVVEVQAAFLLDRPRAINHGARAHVRLQKRMVRQHLVQIQVGRLEWVRASAAELTMRARLEGVVFAAVRKQHLLVGEGASQRVRRRDRTAVLVSIFRHD